MCGVLRRDGDGEQRLLVPVCTVILVSRDRLPLAELGRRHRSQQGQEHVFQGPLTDLGWHHPPCLSHAAHQGFYLGGQIAQLRRRLLPDQVPPSEARQPELQAAADPVLRGQRGAADAQRTAAGQQEQPAAGLGRRGRSRAGPRGRGPARSPRGVRCARSRGRSGCRAGAGRRRAPAGVPKSLGDRMWGPRRVRRVPRSSPTAPQSPSRGLTGNLGFRADLLLHTDFAISHCKEQPETV